MDLVLLVYGISLLSGFQGMLAAIIMVSVFSLVFLLMYRAVEGTQESYHSEVYNAKRAVIAAWAMKHAKTALIVLSVSSTLLTFLPSEKTAYLMVGAYATQKIAENDKVQETGSKVLTIINQKLDSYVDEGIDQAAKAAKGKK